MTRALLCLLVCALGSSCPRVTPILARNPAPALFRHCVTLRGTRALPLPVPGLEPEDLRPLDGMPILEALPSPRPRWDL